MLKQEFSIAIDGPSGAGKSTLAKAIAKELNIIYVDTGAIYRTIGYAVKIRGIDPSDEKAVSAVLPELRITMDYDRDGIQCMRLNGEDVSRSIRLPEISMYASDVSAHPSVRSFLLEMQRSIARENSVIMDGRDIGTVVLPQADVKIFLTARPEVRAKRRCLELEERGTPRPFEEVLAEIEKRDYNDSHRTVAPLKPAEGAVWVDTSELTFEESKELLKQIIEEHLKK